MTNSARVWLLGVLPESTICEPLSPPFQFSRGEEVTEGGTSNSEYFFVIVRFLRGFAGRSNATLSVRSTLVVWYVRVQFAVRWVT